MHRPRLGVNIDHIATLRQARGTRYPEPLLGAQLAQLGGAKAHVTVLRRRRLVHGLCDGDREHGDALGVAAGRRVARFDGVDASANKAIEQLLDIAMQERVLERHGCGAADGEQQLFVLGCEASRHVLLIEGLDDAGDVAIEGEHRHGQDAGGAVAGSAIYVPIEARICVGVWQVDDLAGLCT